MIDIWKPSYQTGDHIGFSLTAPGSISAGDERKKGLCLLQLDLSSSLSFCIKG